MQPHARYPAVTATTRIAPVGGPDAAPPAGVAGHDLLEQLDDAVFAALGGCQSSLDAARKLWPTTYRQTDCVEPALIEESREQYLRYAREVLRSLDDGTIRGTQRLAAALEILAMLAE